MGSTAKRIYEIIAPHFQPVLVDRSIHPEMEIMGDQILQGSFQNVLPLEIIL